jgi:hypothetical protein
VSSGSFALGFFANALLVFSFALYNQSYGDRECSQKEWTSGRTYVICGDNADDEFERIIDEAAKNKCPVEFMPRTPHTGNFRSFVVMCP